MTEEVKKEEVKTEHTSKPGERYSSEELMVRLKVFIGICLALTLIGIVFVVLYSIIFVTQPLNAISPIDQKFFELIIPVATFLCGTLSGIMLAGSGKEAAMAGVAAQQIAQGNFNKPITTNTALTPNQNSWQQPSMTPFGRPSGMMSGGMMAAAPSYGNNFGGMAPQQGMQSGFGPMQHGGFNQQPWGNDSGMMFEPGQSPKFTDD